MQDLNKIKMRKKSWAGDYSDCHSEVRRGISGTLESSLHLQLTAESFVVNKFDEELDSTVVDCLRFMVNTDCTPTKTGEEKIFMFLQFSGVNISLQAACIVIYYLLVRDLVRTGWL